jgi:large subunit ribosomal protein L13
MSSSSLPKLPLRELQRIPLEGLRFRLIDAKGLIVGHIASQIAVLLQGKDKPTFSPKRNDGDVVVVTNAAHVHLTHDSWTQKLYRWHTGLPGGLKERRAVDQWERDPTTILRDAVKGMLPKNKLQLYRMDKLFVYPEDQHPFDGFPNLVPFVPRSKPISIPSISYQCPQGMTPMNKEKYAFRSKAGAVEGPVGGNSLPRLDFLALLTEEERSQVQKL